MEITHVARSTLKLLREHKAARLGASPSWQKVSGGFFMRIDPTQSNDLGYYFGTFERGLVAILDRCIEPGDVCVDVGANKGYFGLWMARRVGSGGLVLCFDPDPPIYAELCANRDRNGFTWMKTMACALGSTPGTCDFALNSVVGNSSRFPNELAQETICGIISVPVRTLDEVLAENADRPRPCSFVKIDAEGSEPLVLRGMRNTISADHPAIYAEVNAASLRVAGSSVKEIEDFLRSLGYELFKIVSGRDHWLRRSLELRPLSAPDFGIDCFYDLLAVTRQHPGWEKLRNLVRAS